MRLTLNAVSTVVALAACAVPIGCGSSPDALKGDDLYTAGVRSEYGYLTDETVENFRNQLEQLAAAVKDMDEGREDDIRTRLKLQAADYRVALEVGLRDDESLRRRAVSAAALGFTGDSRYAGDLATVAANDKEHVAVRVYATLGLSALGPRINEHARRSDIIATLAYLCLPTHDADIRLNAIRAYAGAFSAAQGDTLAPLTKVIVDDPNDSVRREALVELGKIGDAGALPEITRIALKDPAVSVRAAAALALGGIAHPRALESLKEAMSDTSPTVRLQAVYALRAQRTIEPELVVELVIEGLDDFDEKVREAAAVAAGEVGEAAFARPLVQTLNDRSDNVRLAVVEAMGSVVKDPKDAFPLVFVLDDGNADISSAALRSLRRSTGVNIEKSSEDWRKWFYEQYPDLDPDVFYKDKPRPRIVSSGIRRSPGPSSSSPTSRTPRTPRTPRNTTRPPRSGPSVPGR